MKFNKNIAEFLNGDKFDNSLHVTISEVEPNIITRITKLEELVKGKKIIHLGCCDHIPLIKKKIENNVWLHSRVTDTAEKCLGIDIDEDGIDYLRKELSHDNVIQADITSAGIEEVTSERWDYILIGEILEHVDNPIAFLSSINELYGKYIDRIIITVPNAFSLHNFTSVKKHDENINSDHRYWFSPYTLGKIGTRAGLAVEEFFFVQEVQPTIGKKAKLLIFPYIKRSLRIAKLRKTPPFRDILMMILSFRSNA